MINNLWKKINISNFYSIRDKILKLREEFKNLSDEKIREEFRKYKSIIEEEKNENEIKKKINNFIVPIFSLVMETIYRKIKILLFPTQVLGGVVLHYGNIAQMNTGEGKTLTVILPVCLNSLIFNKKIIVITVNDYLSERDWKICKPVFDFFDIKSGAVLNENNKKEKKEIYENCKIIYTTGSRNTFDYLENNLIKDPELAIKWNPNSSIAFIDEVDSILIDGAVNPMIISSSRNRKRSKKSNENKIAEIYENFENENKYIIAKYMANILIKEKDYKADEKNKTVWLTREGAKKIENNSQMLFQTKISNIFSFENHFYNCLINNSLKAKNFYKKYIDYIVDEKENRIIIIDQLTGRLVKNRVYESEIQKAIEIKENVKKTEDSLTIATITYQNYFRMFSKISGMTGTATEEQNEFFEVYGMEVIPIPPYKKLIRKDKNDLIFFDKESKYKKIIEEIKKNNFDKRRPILIGSPNVETSEIISSMLSKEEIFHFKLNAVNHLNEAEIISNAGKIGSITISTNMAGRGTDIILSEESKKAGGLLVIGVERGIRRIDDQLKGRAGRQGEPGETRFYISLEDDLIKRFSIDKKIKSIFNEKKIKNFFDESAISGKIFDMIISEPQEIIKNMSSSYRKILLHYDFLIDKKRKRVYKIRNYLLFSKIIELEEESNGINPDEVKNIKEKKNEMIEKIDLFWSDYLEILNIKREMAWIRNYFPQNPTESFLWESNKEFNDNFPNIEKEVEKFLNKKE